MVSHEHAQRRRRHIAAVFLATLAVYSSVLMISLARHGFVAGSLVHAGEMFTSGLEVPANVPIAVGSAGYDGQFYYRLALDPFLEQVSLGPRLDRPAYRHQRILYPLLARAVALGRWEHIPVAMMLVNLVSLAALGGLGAYLAMSLGRSANWGFVFALYPGFGFSVLHDLPEPVAAVFLLGGIVALRARRYGAASVFYSFGVLTRETVLVVVLGVLAAWAWSAWRGRSSSREAGRSGGEWIAGAVPVVLFLVWQAYVTLRWGHPAFAEGAFNTGPPLLGLLERLTSILQDVGKGRNLFDLLIFLGFGMLAASALARIRPEGALLHEKVAFVLYGLFSLTFTILIWEHRGGFLRALTELYIVGFVIVTAAHTPVCRILPAYWAFLFAVTAVWYTGLIGS